MADELVTLTSYRFASKADLARMLLEQEGIAAFVADANVVTADWFLGNAIGYVKLQVPRSQAERAAAILNDNPQLLDAESDEEDETDGTLQCLECGQIMPDDASQCEKCGWSYGSQESDEELPGTP